MKIAYSAAVRIARSWLVRLPVALDSKIERWTVGTTDPALLAFNSVEGADFITDDGLTLFDSPADWASIPTARAVHRSSSGDGAGVGTLLRQQALRYRDAVSAAAARSHCQDDGRKVASTWAARQSRAIDALKEAAHVHDLATIGEITVGCAPISRPAPANEPWRPGHPQLSPVRQGRGSCRRRR